ncbi:hypothetical protein NT6N_26300 [Oceaniferula spumae]|uniref:Ice-binding protein C-terminal domain-containing protein n=1 Tax=Oceaniferula spumae TaxID=2979115 RepID=A0AAT9FNM0_9BACT
MPKASLLSFGIFAAATLSSQAVIVWTGASDSNPFNDANWDFSGSSVSNITPNGLILDDLTVSNVGFAASGNAGVGFSDFALGDGFSLTITGTSFDLTGTDGFAGSGNDANTEIINLIDSTSSIQYISQGIILNVDGTSSLTVRGGGDGINSQIADTRINLSTGGTLTMSSAAELDEQIGEGDIFVNGTQVTLGNKATLLSGTGATVTGIPEPSSTALLGLGGVALILRRRK